MPKVTIWMLRMSLIYLTIGVIIGSLILIHKATDLHPAVWSLLPVHIEFAMIGWVLQFVMGTAYWMFPRYLEGPGRGNKSLAVWMVLLLNAGIILTAIAGFTNMSDWLELSGRALLLASVMLFMSLMWRRVVSYLKR